MLCLARLALHTVQRKTEDRGRICSLIADILLSSLPLIGMSYEHVTMPTPFCLTYYRISYQKHPRYPNILLPSCSAENKPFIPCASRAATSSLLPRTPPSQAQSYNNHHDLKSAER